MLSGREISLCGPEIPKRKMQVAGRQRRYPHLLWCCCRKAVKRVCTMCTPWASDRVVLVPDWPGLRRISGEWREVKDWNPVRVPPRAQCFRRSGGFLVFFRVHIVHTLASDLMFRVCGVPECLFDFVGEQLSTADQVPVSAGSSSSFVLSSGFRVHFFMVARAAYNMTC